MKDMQTFSPEALEGRALRTLFSGFNEQHIRYAVLRNHEQLPDRVGSRDIDLLVHPRDLERAKAVVIQLANDFGLSVSDLFIDDMFFSIWLFRRLEQGHLFTLSIDLFPGRRVYGLELYAVDDALSDLRFHQGIPVVRDSFVFLDKWLYHLVVGQPTHEKYDEKFAQIANENYEDLLDQVAAFISRDEAAQRLNIVRSGRSSFIPALSKGARLLLLLRRFNSAKVAGLAGVLTFLAFRLRDQFRLRGLFISISGPDGSGKTTVIDVVISQLDAIYGKGAVTYAHFRPTLLPRIADVAKATRAIEKVDADYSNPHRAKPSGIMGSLARLGYYYSDYLLGYFRSVRPVLLRRQIALFDRYYYDMICDPGRSRIGLPCWVLRLVGWLLPLPRHAFFIHVNADEIYRRKQELSLERIKELNGRYLGLVRSGVLQRIDNEGPFEQAAAEIVDTIVKDRDAKARRLLADISG